MYTWVGKEGGATWIFLYDFSFLRLKYGCKWVKCVGESEGKGLVSVFLCAHVGKGVKNGFFV